MFLILNLSAYNSDNIKNKNLVTTSKSQFIPITSHHILG